MVVLFETTENRMTSIGTTDKPFRIAKRQVYVKRCTRAPCNRPMNMELSRHDIGTCRGRCGRRDQRHRGG
ncbi:hypothetical protein EOA32_27080 [Mesorhizobium sp. M1A.F.Ca.ET.072.01.1.1]|nr:hypothetical protein EOA32_27080 [Mesorhizobium sp. M1A.F.Ca.ET.072.01.1.1]